MESAMEVDDTLEVPTKETSMDVESEEGELSDDADDDAVIQAEIQSTFATDSITSEALKKPDIPGIRVFCPLESEMKIQNRAGGFITGIDVFGKEEQARLVERAKRFGLDSSQTNLITEQSLKKLYRSVGVKEGDDKEFLFDSLRMHGTEAMSTQDVFEYFKDYAPTSIEWIDDESCNVVWLDNLSAIRAMMGLSKPIKHLNKLREQEPKQIKTVSKPKKEPGSKSGDDSDVIMIEDDNENSTKKAEQEVEEELASDPEAIDALELGLSIPPGRWRKGNTHPNSDGILLRFRPRVTKSKSDGPQRLPQPVFGMVGLVSKSRKQRIKDGLLVRPKLFHDDMGDDRDFVISSDEEDGRNPWGTLAKSWGNIDRARRPPPPPIDDDLFGPLPPPALPPILRLPPMPIPPNSILNRIGLKPTLEKRPSHSRTSRRQAHSKSKSQSRSPSPAPVLVKPKSSLHARLYGKRRRQDEQDSEDSAFSGSESEGESWTRKSKVPRMKMYADEEENKVKERIKLQARRRLSPPRQTSSTDLRNRLGREAVRHGRERTYHELSRSSRSDRVVQSERVKSHSRPKPTVKSVASSVWSRLATDKNIRIKQEKLDSSDSSASESDHSDTTSGSEEENLRITRTLRDEESDKEDSSKSESDSSSDSDDSSSSEKGGGDASRPRGDLRSKLGSQTSSKNGKSKSSAPKKAPKPRSPLRIEIDNDEYYRSHREQQS